MNTDSKLLSIIIPTYNMEAYLGKCLDSLIINDECMQKVLEVLVIIDGATDHSSAIAHEYQKRLPGVFRIIDKENGNYGSCVNRGLQEATGRYVKILDADDRFDTIALEEVLDSLQTIDADLIITDYRITDEHGNVTAEKSYSLPINTMLDIRSLVAIAPHMAMHAVIYKTENLRRIEYRQTQGISYTDQEWIFEPMTTVTNLYYINTPLYLYLLGREGQTMNMSALARNIHHNLMVIDRLIKIYNATPHDAPIYGYLKTRIEGYSQYVYAQYLFNTDVMDVKPLIAFDKKLKTACNSLYRHLATLWAGKLPYIRLWRLLYYTNDHGINNFFLYRKYRFWH